MIEQQVLTQQIPELSPFEQQVRKSTENLAKISGAVRSGARETTTLSGSEGNIVHVNKGSDSAFASSTDKNAAPFTSDRTPNLQFSINISPNSKADGRGNRSALAKVTLPQGRYNAAEHHDGFTGNDTQDVTIEREGYGKVDLKNPRAKKLIASLAHKAIANDIEKAKS